MTYTVVLMREDDGRYAVSVPAIKGCYTQGDTIAEALQMAQEAIGLFIDVMVEDGKPIPAKVSYMSLSPFRNLYSVGRWKSRLTRRRVSLSLSSSSPGRQSNTRPLSRASAISSRARTSSSVRVVPHSFRPARDRQPRAAACALSSCGLPSKRAESNDADSLARRFVSSRTR